MGSVATIRPGVGAVSFAAVVIVTMFAASAFDPRLMWDAAGETDDRERPAVLCDDERAGGEQPRIRCRRLSPIWILPIVAAWLGYTPSPRKDR
jgi:hypothetical protein